MKFGFTARQVTHLTGVPYSTLNLWAKKGLVRPTISPGTGTGSERVYSFSDLVSLKVAFDLRKSGVTTNSLEKVVKFLKENEHLEQPLAEARLVVSGRDVLIARNDRQLVSALAKPGQGCLSFVVDLPRTIGKLSEIAESARSFAVGVLPARPDSGARKKSVVAARNNQRKRIG